MVGIPGYLVILVTLTGIPLLVCGADLLCISHRRHPVGFWVTRLCRNHPLVAGGVSVVLGAMISHFFLHMNN